MKLIISITAIFALSATLFGADIDFNSSPLGAEEVPGCQGRYDIVEVTEGDHALRVYSDGKEDFGGARIPLLEGKVIEKNFKLFVDCQLTTAHAAGRLVSIGDWNANEWLLRIDAVGGKMMLRGTSFRTGKPADRELCVPGLGLARIPMRSTSTTSPSKSPSNTASSQSADSTASIQF